MLGMAILVAAALAVTRVIGGAATMDDTCWSAKVMDPENDPIDTFPICDVWRAPDHSAKCYSNSLLRISYDVNDPADVSMVQSPSCPSNVIFPSKITPWTYIYRPDAEDGVGGFKTPLNSIRMLTSSTFGEMYVYLTCGSMPSLQFDADWGNIRCAIITTTAERAPKLCAFLAYRVD